MSNERNRILWPFQAPPLEQQSEEIKAKVAFLEEAHRQGFQAYVDQNDCGATSPNGRESLIVWRGKQRSELLLIEANAVKVRKSFTDLSEAVAFRRASSEALAWLSQLQPSTGGAG